MHRLNTLLKIQTIDHGHGEYRGVRVFHTDEVVRVLVPQTPAPELHAGLFPERPDADVGDDLVPLESHLLHSLKDVNGDCLADVTTRDWIVLNLRQVLR